MWVFFHWFHRKHRTQYAVVIASGSSPRSDDNPCAPSIVIVGLYTTENRITHRPSSLNPEDLASATSANASSEEPLATAAFTFSTNSRNSWPPPPPLLLLPRPPPLPPRTPPLPVAGAPTALPPPRPRPRPLLLSRTRRLFGGRGPAAGVRGLPEGSCGGPFGRR